MAQATTNLHMDASLNHEMEHVCLPSLPQKVPASIVFLHSSGISTAIVTQAYIDKPEPLQYDYPAIEANV